MNVTTNFKKEEFTCRCGCNFNEVDVKDVEKLQKLRTKCGFAFLINSCCRCKIHNKGVGGERNSEHLE